MLPIRSVLPKKSDLIATTWHLRIIFTQRLRQLQKPFYHRMRCRIKPDASICTRKPSSQRSTSTQSRSISTETMSTYHLPQTQAPYDSSPSPLLLPPALPNMVATNSTIPSSRRQLASESALWLSSKRVLVGLQPMFLHSVGSPRRIR